MILMRRPTNYNFHLKPFRHLWVLYNTSNALKYLNEKLISTHFFAGKLCVLCLHKFLLLQQQGTSTEVYFLYCKMENEYVSLLRGPLHFNWGLSQNCSRDVPLRSPSPYNTISLSVALVLCNAATRQNMLCLNFIMLSNNENRKLK